MNRKKALTIFMAISLIFISTLSFSQTAEELFPKAIQLEEVKGELEKAIEIFQTIIKRFPDNNPIASKAQFHIGLCYEKLGLEEAQKAYRAVVNNYPGQKNEVALAKERLSQLLRLAEKISKAPLVPKFTKIKIASNPQNGVLSPDGKMLAFTSGDGVWIVPLHGNVKSNIAGEPKLLANVPGAWNFRNFLAWSGDGKWIAVNGGENGEDCAYILSISGGEPRKIQLPARSGTFNYRLSLSPDGQTLAFSAINPSVKIDKTDFHIRFSYVVSTKNGEPKLISKGSGTHPAFSPDGKHIAYIDYEMRSGLKSNYSYISKLWIVESSGENPQMLATRNGFLHGLIWSPDGRFFATSKADVTGKDEIFIYPLSPDLSKLEEPAIIKSNNSCFGILAGWTPNNEIGVFQWSKEHIAIYSVLASGGKAVQVIPEELWPYYPRWSPDGKNIFFRRVGEHHVLMAYVPAKGGNPVEVPVRSARDLMSKVPGGGHNISPDGKKIVISAYQEPVDPKEGPDIWVINLDGSNPLRLTHDGLLEGYPCWSPDGQWIAFKDRHAKKEGEGYEAIYIIAATGGEIKQVTAETDIVGNGAIAFSPDGTNITFFSEGKIKNIPLEGGQQKVVVGNVKFGRHSHMAYSPDGLKIAYNIDGKIWIRKIDDGGTEELETGLSQNVQISEFSWSPNGEKIAFVASSGGELEFYLVENFLPLEKLAQKEKEVEATPKTITSQKIWSGPDTDMSGTPSPDGEFLTFMDYETGNLAIHNILTSESQLITKEATWEKPMQFTTGSKVSPNGKQIAYSWYNVNSNYEIRLTDVDNPQPKVLYGNKGEDVYPAAWSADGKIIYARSHLNKTQQTRILAITIASGEIQILKTIDVPYWTHLSASPDNQFIVFDVSKEKDNGNFDIHIMSTKSKIETSLIEHPANDRLLGWFPNKNQILFKSDRSGTWDVWTVSVSKGKLRGEPKRILTDFGQVSPMGITNNGTFYYSILSRKFTALSSPLDIVNAKLELESGKPMLGSIMYAELSPDGKSIAYTKEIQETAGPGWYYRPLFVMDLESGKEILLLNWDEARYPKWSPDGKTISITGYDKGREFEKDYRGGIYTIEVESAKVKEILAFSMLEENEAGVTRSISEWSKDQKSIYYNTNNQLIKREVKSGQEEILIQNKMISKRTLDLSPDGESLLFCCENHINIIPSRGGEAKTLYSLKEDSKIEIATWSPDGKYVFFVERLKKSSVLWRISAEGKNPIEVCQLKGPIPSISIHPNGNEMIITAFNQEVEIWRTTNLLLDKDTFTKE